MYLAARTNPFNNLLANVASFVEIQSLGLSGLLGQIAIPYVLAILRNAVENAPPLKGLRSDHLPTDHTTAALFHVKPTLVPTRFVWWPPTDPPPSPNLSNLH